jgi:ribosomal protein L37AE/L43A
MFVSSRAVHTHGEASGEVRGIAGAHPVARRLRERETAAVAVGAAQGFACPHCAVENPWFEHVAGDVVECDYCGSAFAPPD